MTNPKKDSSGSICVKQHRTVKQFNRSSLNFPHRPDIEKQVNSRSASSLEGNRIILSSGENTHVFSSG
jgi:hypothetical protein